MEINVDVSGIDLNTVVGKRVAYSRDYEDDFHEGPEEDLTEDQLNGVAWDAISATLRNLSSDAVTLGEWLQDDFPNYTAEDVEALGKLIKEGHEMFHEIWAMGS